MFKFEIVRVFFNPVFEGLLGEVLSLLICAGAVTRLDYDEDFEEEGEAKVKNTFSVLKF